MIKTMFGNTPFGGVQQPNYEDIRRQIQFNQLNQQNIYVQQNTMYEEYSKLIQDLTPEEQATLMNNQDFINSRVIFEQGFSEFLANKFKDEYISTKAGESCMRNMLETTKKTVNVIKDEVKEERERLRALSKLLQENPNILDEIIANKATQITNSQNTNTQVTNE